MKKGLIKKLSLIVIILALILLFFFFDLGKFLTLDYLKGSFDSLKSIYENNKIEFIAIFFVVYVIVAALSVPGAVPLTLAAGAFFGLVLGTIIVSFASTIGATIATIFSRYVLGDWVQNKFKDKLKKINKGVEKEGSFYLFTLRLIPIFPFFVINLAMGLTKIRLWTYYWVSQIGMLPGTVVFVFAGLELSKIESVSDIFSPGIWIAFILIAFLPIVIKKLLNLYKKRRK